GALGQIGTELTVKLREIHGEENVLPTDIKAPADSPLEGKPFEIMDVTDYDTMERIARDFKADTIMHLAALLSAVCGKDTILAWESAVGGLVNALEASRALNLHFSTPNSIGAIGPATPEENTPQTTIQRPTTMDGVNKVSGELLCNHSSD